MNAQNYVLRRYEVRRKQRHFFAFAENHYNAIISGNDKRLLLGSRPYIISKSLY
jgi:hypothetical protein